MNNEKAVKKINELLRGEISAVETYQQAVKKEEHSTDIQKLRDMQFDHQRVVEMLNEEVKNLGGEPETSSGAWGTWAKTVEGAAAIFGDKAALKALKEGEEHGVKSYQEVLEESELPFALQSKVRATILPMEQRHIQYLDSLIAAH